MTTFLAPTLQDIAYSGQDAFAAAHGSMAINAQVGDKIRLNQVYAGTKIYNAKLITAALGAGVTISLGFETDPTNVAQYQLAADTIVNDTAFVDAVSAVAASFNQYEGAPIYLTQDAYIVATIGGAPAVGQIDSVIEYEFRGTP